MYVTCISAYTYTYLTVFSSYLWYLIDARQRERERERECLYSTYMYVTILLAMYIILAVYRLILVVEGGGVCCWTAGGDTLPCSMTFGEEGWSPGGGALETWTGAGTCTFLSCSRWTLNLLRSASWNSFLGFSNEWLCVCVCVCVCVYMYRGVWWCIGVYGDV